MLIKLKNSIININNNSYVIFIMLYYVMLCYVSARIAVPGKSAFKASPSLTLVVIK